MKFMFCSCVWLEGMYTARPVREHVKNSSDIMAHLWPAWGHVPPAPHSHTQDTSTSLKKAFGGVSGMMFVHVILIYLLLIYLY